MALSRSQHAANVAANSYQTDRWGNRVAPAPVRAKNDMGTGDITHGVRRRANNLPPAELMNDPLKLQAWNLRNMGRYAEAEKIDGKKR
ncbi:TPA: hypothetical protein MBH56_005498 [Klebsiella pneumoniae]|nr:hypothetical protein [Klebsiella pneumoniae]